MPFSDKIRGTIESETKKKAGFYLVRLTDVISFQCDRCKKEKTSKNVFLNESFSEKPWCNACYGYINSLEEAFDPNAPFEQGALESELIQQAKNHIKRLPGGYHDDFSFIEATISDRLDERTIKYIKTAEFYIKHAENITDMDYTVIIIELCKGIESELEIRCFDPFKQFVNANYKNLFDRKEPSCYKIRGDLDKRVFKYFDGKKDTPPSFSEAIWIFKSIQSGRNAEFSNAWDEFTRNSEAGKWLVTEGSKILEDIKFARNVGSHTTSNPPALDKLDQHWRSLLGKSGFIYHLCSFGP